MTTVTASAARADTPASEQADLAAARSTALAGSPRGRWWANRAEVCRLVAAGTAQIVTDDPAEHGINVFHPDGRHTSAGTIRKGGRWIGWYTTSGDILPIR